MDVTVAGRRVVVVGAARSGLAAVGLLAAAGARVTLTDVRESLEEADALRARGITLELGGHRMDTLRDADLIVLSPGVPPGQPLLGVAREHGVPIVAELELASWFVRGRVVAVTGTKGKSTTTTLIARMLDESGLHAIVGGNIGVPLSAQVADSMPETVHVVEVSSFQLEGTDRFHPWVAVMLNFFPDHLDRHATEAEYAEAKARIFANQTPNDWVVVNADDEHALMLAARSRARRFTFGLGAEFQQGVGVVGDALVARLGLNERRLVPLSAVRVRGQHLRSDVAAAVAVATLCGADAEAMVRAVERFTGLEHALEAVGSTAGVSFVNDSKATNVESARRAIESFDGRIVVIMGGRFKGGDFSQLRTVLTSREASVVAIGEARPLIHAAFDGVVDVHAASDMREAVRLGYALARGDGTVLLAPACASFDMFDDYAHRGRVFKQEVEALARERGEGRGTSEGSSSSVGRPFRGAS
ncbi:MAG: UDP-N-acetylmuramoyl-L-alanine--D-glutamate ligase [Luteitalea sp.]|nr:UDP-N-acetylmuramoyl-L-alanine--D-glutamate ligase [Luteitalea sp.]